MKSRQFTIPALPCLRFKRQTAKPMPISYTETPVSIGDHMRKKRMKLKLLQKDVANICGLSEYITNSEKKRNTSLIQYYPRISNFFGILAIRY